MAERDLYRKRKVMTDESKSAPLNPEGGGPCSHDRTSFDAMIGTRCLDCGALYQNYHWGKGWTKPASPTPAEGTPLQPRFGASLHDTGTTPFPEGSYDGPVDPRDPSSEVPHHKYKRVRNKAEAEREFCPDCGFPAQFPCKSEFHSSASSPAPLSAPTKEGK
jgi:hypothetical protein